MPNPFARGYDPQPHECEVCGYVNPSTAKYFLHLSHHDTGDLARVLEPGIAGGSIDPGRNGICRCKRCKERANVRRRTVE